MHKGILALVALVAVATAAYGAPPAAPQLRDVTLTVTAAPCPQEDDGVCLAYNGQIPGPTLDINLGDTLRVTMVNAIPATIGDATSDPGLAARLAAAEVSWHVHGTALPVASDGIAAHPGTNLVDSSTKPGGTYTHTVRAAFAGTWHYHDHVLGLDGDEGAARGLYGALLVRPAGEPRPDHVLDLHLLDGGANGGRGLHAFAAPGDRIEVVVVGLGNFLWTVTLRDPSNALVGTTLVGPGMSERLVIPTAAPGTYTWRATGGFPAQTGTVVVG